MPLGAEQVRAALLDRILERTPLGTDGAVLPAERVLADELGTSRVTLRQATATLADWGLVEPVRGSGVRVRAREEWSLRALPALIALPDPASPTRALASEALALRRGLARQLPANVQDLRPDAFANAFADAEAAWRARADAARFVALDAAVPRAALGQADAWASAWLWNDLSRIAVALAERRREPLRVADDYLARQRDWLGALHRGDGRTAARTLATHLGRLDRELLRALPGAPARARPAASGGA